MFNLTNKTAIITGGGSGIGKAISVLFAKQGANVFILDVDEDGAQKSIEEIKAEGGTAEFMKCNVSSVEEVESVINKIAGNISGIDIIVNNAGVAHVGTVETTAPGDIDRLF